MTRFKSYIWMRLKNKGFGLLDGCDAMSIGVDRLKHPERFRISDFRHMSRFLDIPDNEMEKKIIEIYRHGDLENRYL